ncbi:hypothetical protein MWU52_17160 [Jannaschia sp. S6380]|uniref:hypothetical protein n=1 Tax=Jannaschia sp. S6380 TaxID=2926408 RepID=UPI001FF43803|nr:hypothetical protein [Jannaschia sp. S6380]MCK0169286.1 hypothetical protein [Jannaschia sp. S6380]
MSGFSDEAVRLGRATMFVIPAAVLGGVLATAVVVLGDMRQTPTIYQTISPDSIQNIEFVIRATDALGPSLRDACDVTGCDAADLHPMITASVAAMTEAELQEALDAQARIVMAGHAGFTAADPNFADRRSAALEFAAANRLADFYRAELLAR